MHPHEIGRTGEAIAVKLFEDLGYEILARNWRYSRTEIDLIARDRNFLVIAEVKTRTGVSFGYPDEAVGARKTNDLAAAAAAFQEEADLDLEFRFDIVSILILPDKEHVFHLIDAFHV